MGGRRTDRDTEGCVRWEGAPYGGSAEVEGLWRTERRTAWRRGPSEAV